MFEVIIFDLDGLLVDSEPVQFRAFNEVFGRFAEPMTHQEYRAWRGWKVAGRWIEARGLVLDPDQLRAQKKLVYDRLIKEEIELKPGARQFVSLAAGHYRLCVASGSRRDSIEGCLQKFSLRSHFENVFSATELERGKPHPDVFLEAARHMQVEPRNAVVVEDSVPGLRAAQAAGMKCIVCPDAFLPEPADHFQGASLLVDSLAELNVEGINALHA